MSVVESGSDEGVKCAFHGALFALSVICGVYNASVWRKRGGGHHIANVVIYTMLCGHEAAQVAHHARGNAHHV